MLKWLFPRHISSASARGRQGVGISCGALACLALLGTAAPVQAQDDDYNDFEITPFYGYMAGGEFEDPVAGGDIDVEENNNFGVIFNASIEPWRHYELLYSSQSTELSGVTPMDIDVQYLQLGGIVSNPDATRVIPYFGLTVGAARFSPDLSGLDDETKLAFSIAGGFRVPITDHIGLRLDARVFVTLLDTDGNIFCVSDNGVGTCRIRAKSDTFLQYSAGLGLIVGF